MYQYPGGRKLVFPDFEIESGDHCLLLGDSGCGKTTLLHLIGGLLRMQSGSIEIAGQQLAGLSESELDHFRGRRLGFIFQRNHLVNSLSVSQNLSLANYLTGSESQNGGLESVLSSLNMLASKDAKVSSLSYGQAQRVAIARALMNKPAVILADEPTSALDDRNCYAVLDLLFQVAEEHKTMLLIATHDSRLKSRFKRSIQL